MFLAVQVEIKTRKPFGAYSPIEKAAGTRANTGKFFEKDWFLGGHFPCFYHKNQLHFQFQITFYVSNSLHDSFDEVFGISQQLYNPSPADSMITGLKCRSIWVVVEIKTRKR